MADFTDKVVLITGASSGIGAAMAEAFSKHGATLSLTGRDVTRLEKTSHRCVENGTTSDKVLLTPCDLTEPASLDVIIERTVERFGQIDVLANCAGISSYKPLESRTMEEVDKEYKILFRAPFFLSQKAMPYLKQTKGCIINISSITSLVCTPGTEPYSAFKAALDNLTKVLALGAAASGVRVNAISPGAVKTNMLSQGLSPEELEEMYAVLENESPLGRVAEASDIASTAVFLASPAASLITGINLIQDGGTSLGSAGNENLDQIIG